jgi:hypothetical protein
MTQATEGSVDVPAPAGAADAGVTLAPRVPYDTEIERRAARWIEPYNQAWHLVRARDWLVQLDPDASLEMRLAVLTHDIERMFPGGPVMDKSNSRWDDPDYLYAHASRSADVVEKWVAEQGEAGEELDLAELRRLITLHEFGGLDGADVVQAGDSLSFLETLREIVRHWVTSGECDTAQARRKHEYMARRIRLPEASELARPLLAQAIVVLEGDAAAESSDPE